MVKAEELARVVAFRNRLVAHANYVTANVGRWEETSPEAGRHIGEEQAWLQQEYGSLYRLIARYGVAGMTGFGMVLSQDVIRDTIGRPAHPSYGDMAELAIQHLDMAIGRMRGDVEATGGGLSADRIYRLTSPVFWLGRVAAAARWLVSTNAGRITALVGAVALAVIGGIVSGVAQAWFEQLLR